MDAWGLPVFVSWGGGTHSAKDNIAWTQSSARAVLDGWLGEDVLVLPSQAGSTGLRLLGGRQARQLTLL